MPKPTDTIEQVEPETSPAVEVNFRTRQAQAKREKMLARLMTATMEVCADTNRRGTAVIDDVVRAAGVSRGAFYWYFDSLDEAIEAVGRRMIEEIGAETSSLFGDQNYPVEMRAAIGGQVILCRARMDRIWANYLSNVHVLLDDSPFVTRVRRNLVNGQAEGVFRYSSLRMAVDFQIGAVMGGIRRCTFDPAPPMHELLDISRMILIGLGISPERAAVTVVTADAIITELGSSRLPWWRAEG